jgi:hypothetical protein
VTLRRRPRAPGSLLRRRLHRLPPARSSAPTPSAAAPAASAATKPFFARAARQADPAWQDDYEVTRPPIERNLAHLLRRRHGGHRARVRGRPKVDADFNLLAAAVNLARLAALRSTHRPRPATRPCQARRVGDQGQAANRRLVDIQRAGQGCAIETALFDRIHSPPFTRARGPHPCASGTPASWPWPAPSASRSTPSSASPTAPRPGDTVCSATPTAHRR